jgi:hypothetical protein
MDSQINYQEVLKDLDYRRAAIRAELESKCRELDVAIAAIQGILRGNNNGGNNGHQMLLTEQPQSNNRSIVLKFLAQDPMRVYNPKAVSLAVGLPEKAVRGLMNRLAKKRTIQLLGRGKYRHGKTHEAVAA